MPALVMVDDDHDNTARMYARVCGELLGGLARRRFRRSASAAGFVTLHGGPALGTAAGHAHQSAGEGRAGNGWWVRFCSGRRFGNYRGWFLGRQVVHLGWGGDADIKAVVGSSKSSGSSLPVIAGENGRDRSRIGRYVVSCRELVLLMACRSLPASLVSCFRVCSTRRVAQRRRRWACFGEIRGCGFC